MQYRFLKNKSCVKFLVDFSLTGEKTVLEIMLRTSDTNLSIPRQFAQQFTLKKHFHMNLIKQIAILLQSVLYMVKISSTVNKTEIITRDDEISVIIRHSCYFDIPGKNHFDIDFFRNGARPSQNSVHLEKFE